LNVIAVASFVSFNYVMMNSKRHKVVGSQYSIRQIEYKHY